MRLSGLLVLLFTIVFELSVSAQSLKESIAEKKFQRMEYAEAAEIYNELATKSNDVKLLLRAAESNLHTGDHVTAAKHYDKANGFGKLEDKDLYNYYRVLNFNGEYEKANNVFSKISAGAYKTTRHDLEVHRAHIAQLKKDSSSFEVNLTSINSEENDFSPFILGNEFYFLSSRRNTSAKSERFAWDNSYMIDVYKAAMKDGKPTDAKAVSEGMRTRYHEGPLCFTADGNTQFMTRNNYTNSKLKQSTKHVVNLKLYQRKKENGQWGKWEEFPFNSDEYSCGHPAISGDGTTLYFVSDMPGSLGETDIWISRQENKTWTKPVNAGQNINTEGSEMFPTLFEDDVLFFSSDGRAGFGGQDLYYAYVGNGEVFESQNVGYPINSHFDDFGMFAVNAKEGFFSSNRGEGKDDIYSFRAKKPLVTGSLHFVVKDKETGQILAATQAQITEDNHTLPSAKTNDKGELKVSVLPGKSYAVAFSRPDYKDQQIHIKSEEAAANGSQLREILMEKQIFGLTGIISDAETQQAVEGVKLSFVNVNNKNETISVISDAKGAFTHIYTDKKIGSKTTYLVKIEKEGYVTKTQNMEINIVKDGLIEVSNVINTRMFKVKLGADLGKMVNIKPIYFDLGKFNIREDAALELDKIVALMKENPNMSIELGSHTDCRGNMSANLSLSDKRAKSSAAYIVSKGIDKSRIYGKGYGESKLLNDCKCEGAVKSNCSEEVHAQNRRTEFKIVKIN